MNDSNFITYYFDGTEYHIYNYKSKKIVKKTKLPSKINKYEILGKKYIQNDENLERYANDLYEANKHFVEYMKSKHKTFDYLSSYEKNGKIVYGDHNANIKKFYYYFSNKEVKDKINESESIDKTEEYYYNQCYNSGLIYQKFKSDTPIQSYGYDKKNFYASILGSSNSKFQMPINKGYESKILTLEKNKLEYGIYNVKITCDDDDITKVFSFSKNHYYTHYSINHAFELKEKYFKDMTIELITDKEYNCYLYKKEDLIKSYDLFGDWFGHIREMKEKIPGNMIVKLLSSSLWGYLTTYKRITVKEENLDNYDIGGEYEIENTTYDYKEEKVYSVLINKENPYMYKYRLKPFITSFGRQMMASIITNTSKLENVLYVRVDGAVFSEKLNFKYKNTSFVEDASKTGMLLYPLSKNN